MFGTCLLSKIIDTQVARRGRQYHRNPPPYKNRPTKKNHIYKIKRPPPPRPTQPTPHHRHPTQPNTPNTQTQHHHQAQPNPTQREKSFN